MNNVKINNEIGLTYPDGYSEMSAEELGRYFGSAENRWGAFNADNHTIISVGWTKAGFFNTFKDADTFLSHIEAGMRLRLLNYQRVSSFTPKIGSKTGCGIRFEYRVNDSIMVHTADLIVFKYKKKFYAIHFVTRKSKAAAVTPELQEVLDSVTMG